jgi:branched-chain amino acid transport system ATP-binding protein
MTGDVVLEASELSVGYSDIAVVRDLSLIVRRGEVVALLGPNGAGKTSTLLALSGLARVLNGRRGLMGLDVTGLAPHLRARRGLAHVPEGRGIFYGLTVRENFSVSRTGYKNHDRALRYFPQLDQLIDRRAGLLSGGEQQMLAIGRALLGEPRVLLVDELSLGLSPLLTERLMPVIRTLADETGCGVLLVEQHIDMALEIADSAYVLAHGDCVLSGSANEVLTSRAVIEAEYMGAGAAADTQSRSNQATPRLLPPPA